MSVSLANGNRQILSGRNAADESVLGTGPAFSLPYSLVTDFVNGVTYVADVNLQAVFAIDLATGQRIIVSR